MRSSKAINKKAIVDGFKKAKTIIEQHVQYACIDAAQKIVEDAEHKHGWTGFTGNAQNAFACTMFGIKGNFVYRFVPDIKPPLRNKIRAGEVVYLDKPYEGKARKAVGKVDLVTDTNSDYINMVEKIGKKNGVFTTLRFMHPIEYGSFLVLKDGGRPLESLRQLAIFGLKANRWH